MTPLHLALYLAALGISGAVALYFIGTWVERMLTPFHEREDVRDVLFALGGDEMSADGIALVADIATGRARKRLAKLLVRMEEEGLVVSRPEPLNWRVYDHGGVRFSEASVTRLYSRMAV